MTNEWEEGATRGREDELLTNARETRRMESRTDVLLITIMIANGTIQDTNVIFGDIKYAEGGAG